MAIGAGGAIHWSDCIVIRIDLRYHLGEIAATNERISNGAVPRGRIGWRSMTVWADPERTLRPRVIHRAVRCSRRGALD
jgi:hypothetical protein